MKTNKFIQTYLPTFLAATTFAILTSCATLTPATNTEKSKPSLDSLVNQNSTEIVNKTTTVADGTITSYFEDENHVYTVTQFNKGKEPGVVRNALNDSTNAEKRLELPLDAKKYPWEFIANGFNNAELGIGYSPIELNNGNFKRAISATLYLPMIGKTNSIGPYVGANCMFNPSNESNAEISNYYLESNPNQFDANPNDGTFGPFDETRESYTQSKKTEDVNNISGSMGLLGHFGNLTLGAGATMYVVTDKVNAKDITNSTFTYDNGTINTISTEYDYPKEDKTSLEFYPEAELGFKKLTVFGKGIGSENQLYGIKYNFDL